MTFPIAHWPDAHFPNAHWPHGDVTQILSGGGGGRKRKFKSWDQRQRERLEEIAKYAKPAPPRVPVREMRPYKTISPAVVKAYANSIRQDDEEAMHVIMALL